MLYIRDVPYVLGVRLMEMTLTKNTDCGEMKSD